MTHSPVVWIMAGGTGGHIMPGLAVADLLRSRGCEIRWLGNPQKMEGRLVSQAGYPMIPVRFSGVRGRGLRSLLLAPFSLLASIVAVWKEASRHRPSLALGMGGYVAMPGGLVAYMRRIPLAVHEQNAIAGKTNLWLAHLAKLKLQGFPNALPAGQTVGNPVRVSMTDLPGPALRYESRQGALRVLVVGGSLGAAALNEIVPQAIASLPVDDRPMVTHQSGQQNLEALQKAYQTAGVDASCVAFIDDMAQALSEADLLICRAGAMTVAEVAAVGVAALFVPFPFAVDDHQTANASYLVSHQAAYLCQQSDLSVQWLATWLETQTREALKDVAVRARKLARPEATEVIARECLSLMEVDK